MNAAKMGIFSAGQQPPEDEREPFIE